NGKPDPGESTDLTITLQNDGSAGVIQVSADLVCIDPYITIDVASASYPDMSSGGTGTSLSAYRFTADEECPEGYKANMTLQISGWGGYYTEETFEIRIGQRPILFVDDDGGDSHETHIMAALDSVGVLYDVWTHDTDGCPPDTIFEQYQSVVWSTGDDYGSLSDPATLDATDEARLMTYLDNGGSLLLSSQDLLLDHNPDAFIIDYLHVAGHNDDEGVNSVSGESDDTVSDGMAFSLSYPFYNFSDHVFPGAGAAGIFYETSKGSALPRAGVQIDEFTGKSAGLVNYCALRYPASGPSVYKVAFFAFAIEAVPESGSYPNNRYTLMRRIMNWFGIGRTASEVMHGDANGDQLIDVGDVVFLVNYLYKGDIPPAPWEAGDANCDGEVDLGDVVYLINYLYKGGDAPPC
ncbi:MAG: dockerin type I repeat-containing protein, partial [Candidatus Zixiibacteriota bacterium]